MSVTASHAATVNHDSRQELFDERHHGADAQKGWNYQIVATAWKAFELDRTPANPWSIQLEGIEDFDVASIRQDGRSLGQQLVQAKSSGDGLSWTVMIRVLESFLCDAQVDAAARFLLVTDRPLTGNVRQLSQVRNLTGSEEYRDLLHTATQRVQDSLEKRHKDSVWVTDELVCHVLESMDVEVVDSTTLLNHVTDLIQNRYGLEAQSAQAYVHYIAGQLFECARYRKTIDHDTLERWKLDLDRLLRYAEEMKAVRDHLVRSLEWTPDERPEDFSEGRQTRAGHVFQRLDIVRDKWMERISEAFERSMCVVICAPSGEGKSTLAFRYALDYWRGATVVRLVGAVSRPDAEAVSEYLGKLQSAYHNVRVLLDNADHDTREWAIVAAACQAAGILMLITTRIEDWYRYSRPDKVSAALVEPILDGAEAARIFAQLQQNRQVHDPHQTVEDAFERVSVSGLLMEFMYYVTHGTMLTDRLEQQLKEIQKNRPLEEAQETLWLLMTVSLASILDCGVDRKRLLGNGPGNQLLRSRLLDSLCGEYVTVDEHVVHGLHSVRSHDIVKAFHASQTDLADRAIELLRLIPDQEVSRFVISVSECDMIDRQLFLSKLPSAIQGAKPFVVSSVLDGLYYIGERDLVVRNLSLFTDVVTVAGSLGPDMLTWFISPQTGSEFADGFEKDLKPDADAPFWQIKSIASKIDQSRRGQDLCSEMLHQLDAAQSLSLDESDLAGTGRLLWWCGVLRFCPGRFAQQLPLLLKSVSLTSVQQEALSDFNSGLYAWNKDRYDEWVGLHADEMLEAYMMSTSCTSASLEHHEFHIKYVAGVSGLEPNEEAMSRLDIGRELFPHCLKYCSEGQFVDVMTINALPPSWNPTVKEIPVRNLPARRDIWLNRTQARAIWSLFGERTNTSYMSAFASARETVLEQFKSIIEATYRMLQGAGVEVCRLIGPALRIKEVCDSIPERAPEAMLHEDPSPRAPKQLPESKWGNSLLSVEICLADVIMGKTERTRALLSTGAQLLQALQPMQDSLERRSLIPSDRRRELADEELHIYPEVLDILRVLFTDFPRARVHAPGQYVAACHKKAVGQVLDRCRLLADKCSACGISLVLPTTVDINQDLIFVPIGVNTSDILQFQTKEKPLVMEKMDEALREENVWLVPLVDGATINDQAYRVYTKELRTQSADAPSTKPMEEMPQLLRQTLPVATGTEPFAMVARDACASAASCLATVYNLLVMASNLSSSSTHGEHVNASALAKAMETVTTGYAELLGGQLEQLVHHHDLSTASNARFSGVEDCVRMVIELVSTDTGSASLTGWLEKAAPVMKLLEEIASVPVQDIENQSSDTSI